MGRRGLAWLVVVVVLGAGCAGSDDEDSAASSDVSQESDESAAGGATAVEQGGGDDGASAAPLAATAAQLVDAGRSVIRTGEVEVRTEDVDGAARAAVRIAEAAGGYLAEQESALGDEATARLVLKVPPDRFGATLDELGGLGEVVARRVGSDDVTDVVVDLEGRLASARASVARLQELLGEAGDVPQVVAVEAELARREGEVESLAGQLRSLESQVDLATITLLLSQPSAAADPAVSEDIPGFLAGLRTGWVAFANVAGGAATALGFALPFLAVAAVIGAPTLWWRRRSAAAAAAA